MVGFRTRKDGRVFPIRRRVYTDTRIGTHEFFNAAKEDEHRRRIVTQQWHNKTIAEKFKNIIARLAPDQIRIVLKTDLCFVNAEAEMQWDLVRWKLTCDLNEEQKVKMLRKLGI